MVCWLREGAHPAAVDLCTKKCEGCRLKRPNFGLPAEGKAWWCFGCAKGHTRAVDLCTKKCEGCGLKRPNFGLPAEGKARWRAGCAKGHAGIEDVVKLASGCHPMGRSSGDCGGAATAR